MPRTLDRAQLAGIGAGQACRRDQGALAGHQLGGEPAKLLAVDRQGRGAMMFGMAVLDHVETVVEGLVADRGARLARLEALAVELIVVVGVLRTGLRGPRSHDRKSSASDTEDLATVHREISSQDVKTLGSKHPDRADLVQQPVPETHAG
jgi:hypothetical protein